VENFAGKIIKNISSRMEDTDNSSSDHKKTSFGSGLRRSCLSFAASVQEGFRYVKAFFVGQVGNPNMPFIFSVLK